MSLKLHVHASKYTKLSKKEQKALKELKHREDIVITNTDEGGAVVRVDVKDYIKESERQLKDTKHYRHFEHHPTTENNATVNKVKTRLTNDKLISNNVSDELKVESPRSPHFYIQPKIHTGKPRHACHKLFKQPHVLNF